MLKHGNVFQIWEPLLTITDSMHNTFTKRLIIRVTEVLALNWS
jgi:hypothetical protein